MKIISLLTLFFTANILLSQQLPQFTEYDANLSMYNPAYTGMKGKMYGNFSGRIQWAGMEGNPNTYAGLYEHQIGKNSVGGSFMYDQLGFEKNHRTTLNYARTISLEKVKFNIGSSLLYSRKAFERQNINVIDPTDPAMQQFLQDDIAHILGINLGASIYNDKFESGIGLANLNSEQLTFGAKYFSTRAHLYWNGAYIITTENIKWRISSLMKTDFTSTTIAGQMRSTIKNLVYVGTGMRNTNSFHGIAGFQLFNKLRVAYLFEYHHSKILDLEHTHELVLSWRLKNE